MQTDDIISRLRSMATNTGTLNCLGCGFEHNCGIRGCRVLHEAADMIAEMQRAIAMDDADSPCTFCANFRDSQSCEDADYHCRKCKSTECACRVCSGENDFPSFTWRGLVDVAKDATTTFSTVSTVSKTEPVGEQEGEDNA